MTCDWSAGRVTLPTLPSVGTVTSLRTNKTSRPAGTNAALAARNVEERGSLQELRGPLNRNNRHVRYFLPS